MQVEQIKILTERLRAIDEAPDFYDEDLPYGSMTVISSNGLLSSYKFIGDLFGEIKIYEKLDGSCIVAGGIIDGSLVTFLMIQLQQPIKLPIFTKEIKQIYLTISSEGFSRQGIATAIYRFLSEKFTLVSDYGQYRGGKRLWKSLAKTNVPVRMFDADKMDWIRDKNDNELIYNGQNLDDDELWGNNKKHLLLVASI